MIRGDQIVDLDMQLVRRKQKRTRVLETNLNAISQTMGKQGKTSPSTLLPSASPFLGSTIQPSYQPSDRPSFFPSAVPTESLATKTPSTHPSQSFSSPPSYAPSQLVSSNEPSTIPSMPPSSFPSKAPSTKSPTTKRPTIDPTFPPSFRASELVSSANPSSLTPTNDASAYSSIAPSLLPVDENRTMFVKVFFDELGRPYLSEEQTSALEDVTKEFLQQQPIAINRVTLIAQELVTISSWSAEGAKIVAGSSPAALRHLRYLEEELNGLVVNFEIELESDALNSKPEQDFVEWWNQSYEEYDTALRKSPSLSSHFKDEEIQNAKENDASDADRSDPMVDAPKHQAKKSNPWTLLHTTLVVASVAVATVSAVVFTRWWNHGGYSIGYRRQENTQSSLVSDGSKSNSSSSPSQRRKPELRQDDSERAEAKSVRSGAGDGIISEESDSGWNTGSGSGSLSGPLSRNPVYASGFLGKSSSSLFDLEAYGQEDVWSVAPDHRLCFSEDGSIRTRASRADSLPAPTRYSSNKEES